MTVYQIPLIIGQEQQLSTSINGTVYNLLFTFCDSSNGEGGWIMDISDVSSVPLISGIPLVTGADLLEQFKYVGIGGGNVSMYVVTDGDPTFSPPTQDNLGGSCKLYYEV